MIREASNTTTATNYALEGEIKDRPSVPIHPKMTNNGPWLELVPNRSTHMPRKYILTKTHCGGFCNHCPYQNFLETPRSFQTACRTGTKAFFPATNNNNNNSNNDSVTTTMATTTMSKVVSTPPRLLPPRRRVTYDIKNNVKKAIHLIRNPLDNIVARFHLDWNRRRRLIIQKTNSNSTHDLSNNDATSTSMMILPNNGTGFQKWCAHYDNDNDNDNNNNNNNNTATNNKKASSSWDKDKTNRWVDRELQDAMNGVPCRGEFYRYIQWHNYAFEMVRDMGIPNLTVYYEDYNRDRLSRTQESILQFLELEPIISNSGNNGGRRDNDKDNDGTEFIFVAGKEYDDFYSDTQKEAVWRFIREFASRETWQGLQHYY
jgi:hypothetical protein